MSHPAYSQFFDMRRLKKEEFAKKRSLVTLHWYERIGELLNDPAYESSENFLNSVQEFIEQHEYVTDKQIEILERIERHPWGN